MFNFDSTATKTSYAGIFDKISNHRSNIPFKIFFDGIAVGSVSFRLSNINLRNFEKNLLFIGGTILGSLRFVKAGDCVPAEDFQTVLPSVCLIDDQGNSLQLALNTTAVPQLESIFDSLYDSSSSLCAYFVDGNGVSCQNFPDSTTCLIANVIKGGERLAELVYKGIRDSSSSIGGFDVSQANCLLKEINDTLSVNPTILPFPTQSVAPALTTIPPTSIFPTFTPNNTMSFAPHHHYNNSYIAGLIATILLALLVIAICISAGIKIFRRLGNPAQELNIEQGVGNRLINNVSERTPLLPAAAPPQIAHVGPRSESAESELGARHGVERYAGRNAFFANAAICNDLRRKDEKSILPEATKPVKKSFAERVEDLKINPEEDKVLKHGICAISSFVMDEPSTLTFKYTQKGVQHSTSNIYEKSKIEKWINVEGKRVDPKSGLKMDSYMLSPNNTLKNLIEERIEHLETKALAKASSESLRPKNYK